MKNTLLKLVTCLLLLTASVTAKAQVTATFTITPPYSTKLSDYATTMGKMVILLTNTTPSVLRVYLKADITGSNGIKISTRPGFRPSQPVVLQPGVPFMVDIPTLSSLYDYNSLDLKNITASDIFQKNGLPEGTYTFCVRAYNFDAPAVALSADEPGGCTVIRLTQLEPPLLMRPADKETNFNGNVANTPQNITFSWNIPAGSDPGTQQYVFRIVEMLDPNKNPADAMNSKTTPAFYETVTNTNILLYGPGEPQLVEGRKYAWSVTALPGLSGSSYRNNGRSEIRSFVYKADALVKLDPSLGSKLHVLVPNDSAKVINVNNDSDLVLSWAFIKNNHFDSSEYATKNILKYKVEVKNAPSRAGLFKQIDYNTTIARQQITVADLASNLTLANALRLKNVMRRTADQCDSIGFVNGASYIATVTALDASGNTVQNATSVPFVYRRVADENNATLVTLKGNLKYSIGYSKLAYKATHTTIQVDVFKKDSGSQNMVKLAQLTTSVRTDDKGGYKASVLLPASFYHDSIFFYLNILNKYYNSDGLPVTKLWMADKPKSIHDSLTVTAAEGLAKAYGYSLKLYVEKQFPAYKVDKFGIKLKDNDNDNDKQWNIDSTGSFIYQTNTKQFDAGIKISLYRKNKQSYMPLVEGLLTEANAQESGYVEVATGVTQLEKDKNGKDVSFVQFHNLIANEFYPGDEYYIIAKQPSDAGPVGNGNNAFGLQGNINFTPLTQDNFTATEISFTHSATVIYKTKNLQFDSYENIYDSSVTAKYPIVSKDPPKSVLTGQIVYKWPTDDKQQTRAYANQDFSVVVGYKIVDKDGTVHYLNDALKDNCSSVTEVFFQSGDGQTNTRLLDAGQVMGSGTTDGNGNFTVSVVNLNKKGQVGTGSLMSQPHAGTDEVAKPCPVNNNDAQQEQAKNNNPIDNQKAKMGYEDETWGTNIGDAASKVAAGAQAGGNNPFNGALQGGLNSKVLVTPVLGAGNYKLGAVTPVIGTRQGAVNAKGVGGSMINILQGSDEIVDDDGGQTLERFYYIVPNNPHLSAVDVDIVADAFAVKDCKQLVSYVRDRKINIIGTSISGVAAKGLIVTIFREVQKDKTLPLGEGDNVYTKGLLVNPELNKTSAISFNGAIKTGNDAANIYNTVYEKLYTTSLGEKDSTGALRQLFADYGKYYVQVCSSPDQDGTLFNSSIVQIDKNATTVTVPLIIPLSRVAGRVLEDGSGLPIKKAVIGGSVSNKTSIYTFSDDNGYYEAIVGNLFPTPDQVKNGLAGSYVVAKDGYNFAIRTITALPVFGAQKVESINLTPGAKITGKIISGEKGVTLGVSAYLKRTNGQVIPTATDGSFTVNLPSNLIDTLKIIPVDPGYFDTTIIINTAIQKAPLNQVVFRRKHRIRFLITEPDNANHAISNAKVYLGNDLHTSNSQGICDFEFENVSINNYSFRIAGPDGIGFIPIVKNVQNEESVTPVVIPVGIQRGSTITGIVKLDGVPVTNARVFVNIANNDPSGANTDALVFKTGVGGNYTITGVPVFLAQQATITATLDTSFTVIGDRQVTIIKTDGGGLLGKADLNLKSDTALTIQSVFGFPISIEKMTRAVGGVWVTGTIKLANGKSKFSLLPGNDVVRITGALFVPQVINGKTFGVPKDNSIVLDAVSTLKFRYLNKYNVMITNDVSKPNAQLVLSKGDDGMGYIGGYINIVDNSFNYPSTYLSFNNQKANFYLSELNNNNTVNTNINAIRAVTTDIAIDQKIAAAKLNVNQPLNAQYYVSQVLNGNGNIQYNVPGSLSALYHLSDASGKPVALNFIQFDGTADPSKSYIAADGKIHLSIGLNCSVPTANPPKFTVDVDDVVLDDSSITPAKGKPLILAFEKWKLQVDNWTLDPAKGGIFSKTATVKTSKLDIPFALFNLRSDMMVMDSFNVAGIQLGGGANSLSDIDPKKAVMVYDTKVGSDQQPHWRFSIAAAEGSNCATIKNLGLLPGAVVGVSYIQLLSNDENIFSLNQANVATPLSGNPMAAFRPTGIFNGSDFFNLIGTIDVNAPRVAPMALTLNYTKGSASISNVSTLFEGKGFVNFSTLDNPNTPNITINKDSIVIKGQVEEKPDKTFEVIPAKFIAVNSATPSYSVQLPVGYELDLSSGSSDGYKLKLDKGYMNVVNGDWDVLTFAGTMLSKMPKDSGITNNHMVFTVYGDVQVDGDGITTTNSTSLGTFTMTYKFKEGILHGTLNVKDVNMGSASITGTVEMQVDKQGFYVVGAGNAVVQGPLPVGGTYTMGFLLGDHPLDVNSDIWQTATQYMYIKNNCWPAQNGNQLKGFFLAAGKMFLDVDKDFDYVIVSGYARAHAGVDANIWANFGNGANAGLKATVYVDVNAGLASAFTGTSINGSLDVKGTLTAAYAQSALHIDASVDATFSATVRQAIPFMDPLEKSVTVEAMLKAGTDGFSFKWVKGTLPVTCDY